MDVSHKIEQYLQYGTNDFELTNFKFVKQIGLVRLIFPIQV